MEKSCVVAAGKNNYRLVCFVFIGVRAPVIVEQVGNSARGESALVVKQNFIPEKICAKQEKENEKNFVVV